MAVLEVGARSLSVGCLGGEGMGGEQERLVSL